MEKQSLSPLPKLEVMNDCLSTYHGKILGEELRKLVKEIFNIDLHLASDLEAGTQKALYPDNIKEKLAVEWKTRKESVEFNKRLNASPKDVVLDTLLNAFNGVIAPNELYGLLLLVYGVNLVGISTLEHARISVFSKGQWISHYNKDLLLVVSDMEDIEVKISPTPYYTEKTGTDQLPEELQQDLIKLGFTYHPEMRAYYYANPNDESILVSFKNQVMGILMSYTKRMLDM